MSVVIRAGPELAALVGAGLRLASADVGRIAIVGGLAVSCRLGQAHRATRDVDAVAEDRTPTVLEVLSELEGAEPHRGAGDGVELAGVPVEVIATSPVDDVEGVEGVDRLFLLGHRFALETAEDLDVVVTGPTEVVGRLPVATPAGLVATKLCAIQGRRRPPEKRASDAYDLFRLLRDLDADGAVAAAVSARGGPLVATVRDAGDEVLVRGVTGLLRNVRNYGPSSTLEELTEDEVAFVGERLVHALDAAP